MIDFSKFKKLTIGGVELKQLFINGIRVWKSGYKNWVKFSTEADGVTIYNGGLGYKNGYRVRSGGGEGSNDGACAGFIPVKGGDVIRFSGWDFSIAQNGNAVNVYNSEKTTIGQFAGQGAYGILAVNGAYAAYGRGSVVKESDTVWKWVVPPAASGVVFIRVSAYINTGIANPGASMIVTVNEEIA